MISFLSTLAGDALVLEFILASTTWLYQYKMAGQEQQTHLSDENVLLLFPLIYCNGSQGTYIAHIF